MQLKLSTQALNALMLALQKSLFEESDIVPILMGWDWSVATLSEEEEQYELYVDNPPIINMADFEENSDTDLSDFVKVGEE